MNALSHLHDVSLAWSDAMLRAVWQSTVILGVVWVVSRSTLVLSGFTRSWLWRLGFLKVTIAIVVASSIDLPLLPAPSSVSRQSAFSESVDVESAFRGQGQQPPSQVAPFNDQPAPAERSIPRAPLGVVDVLFCVWAVGVLAIVLRMSMSLLQVRRLVQGSHEITDPSLQALLLKHCGSLGVRYPPRLLSSTEALEPFLAGLFRPAIVLPVPLLHFSTPQELNVIIRHELAHRCRRDLWWNWLPAICETSLFFHPLILIARSEWGTIHEIAADEMALDGASIPPGDYATCLVAVVERCSRQLVRSPALLTVGSGFRRLRRRLVAVTRYSPPTGRLARCLTFVLLGAGAIAVLPWRLTAQEKVQESVRDASPKKDEPRPNDSEVKSVMRPMRLTVIDPDKSPVAGARIFVNASPVGSAIENRHYVSDAQGEAVVQVPRENKLLRVWVSHRTHVPKFLQWWPEYQPDGHLVPDQYTVRLEKGTVIGGYIQDQEGKAIQGAKVDVSVEVNDPTLATRDRTSERLGEEGVTCLTDESGFWQLDNAPDGNDQKFTIRRRHPDFIDESNWNDLQRDTDVNTAALRAQTAVIVMKRGVVVSGTITDPSGKPVENAVVVWDDRPYWSSGKQETLSDEKGRYRLPPLTGRRIPITVVAKGWAPQLRVLSDISKDRTEDIQLRPGAPLRVRIVDPAGEPLTAYVRIERWIGLSESIYNDVHPDVLPTGIPRRSDADGFYEWTWAPPEEVTYQFSAVGFRSIERGFIPTRDEGHLIVTLEPDVKISGTVTDALTGLPIKAFRIATKRPNEVPNPNTIANLGTVYRDGSYRRSLGQSGLQQTKLHFHADGFEPFMSDVLALADGDATVNVTLTPAGKSSPEQQGNTERSPVKANKNEETRLNARRQADELRAMQASTKELTDDALQIDDVKKREAAIEKIRSLMKSEVEAERRRGLFAFVAVASVRFDKSTFHDLILPMLKSDDGSVRSQAAQALVLAGLQSGDLERLIALAEDPSDQVRQISPFQLVTAAKKDLTTAPGVEKAMLRLLKDDDPKVRLEALRSLWGAKLSPGIEARVLELTRQSDGFKYGAGYDAMYFALSTQANKSEATVKRLIEYLADPDGMNVAGRAAWGLGQGVPESQHKVVAEAALKVVSARTDGYLLQQAMDRLKQYAGPDHVAGLRALLEKPGVEGEFRTGLEAALKKAVSE